MDTFQAIIKRVSIRDYADKQINKEIWEKLVDAARRAPSARAIEPWEFIVITERATLEKIGEIANTGTFIKSAAGCIAVFSQDTKYYLEDCCAATENILIMAADLGLGACWVAGDKKPYTKDIAKILGVPDKFKLVSLISLGWPKNEMQQNKKRSFKEVLHWEKF